MFITARATNNSLLGFDCYGQLTELFELLVISCMSILWFRKNQVILRYVLGHVCIYAMCRNVLSTENVYEHFVLTALLLVGIFHANSTVQQYLSGALSGIFASLMPTSFGGLSFAVVLLLFGFGVEVACAGALIVLAQTSIGSVTGGMSVIVAYHAFIVAALILGRIVPFGGKRRSAQA